MFGSISERAICFEHPDFYKPWHPEADGASGTCWIINAVYETKVGGLAPPGKSLL